MAGDENPSRAFQRRLLILTAINSAVLGVIFGALGAFVMRPAPAEPFVMPEVISAKQFYVRNGKGKPVAAWAALDNTTSLGFFADDKMRMVLSCGAEGDPSIRMFGRDGKERMDLSFRGNGTALTLSDSAGKAMLYMQEADGFENGKYGSVAGLSVGPKEKAGRADFHWVKGEPARIQVWGANGEPLWGVPDKPEKNSQKPSE